MSKQVSHCLIDHITITAASLEDGSAFVRDILGILPQPGGEHPRMGTHNLLLKLGETQFLEVIAPNPLASLPDRPRWFALDGLSPLSRPSLATWVVRTPDIHTAFMSASESLGNIEPMSRGSLNWQMTISGDGSLPLGGAAPALIEWHAEVHPASRLQDHGLALSRLELIHPEPNRVSRLLESLRLEGPVSVVSGQTPRLIAYISTPRGIRLLSAPESVA